MIESLYINNFKAFEKETIILNKDNLLIGENDSGKTSVLQALDIFFNQEKIDKAFVRDQKKPVIIGIMFNGEFYKKEYSGSTFKLTDSTENISNLDQIKYIYIPVSTYDVKKLIVQLACSKAISKTNEEIINKLKAISNQAIDEVISGIDKELIVVDNSKTNIEGKEDFKYDKALSFIVNSNGIPVESRGLGYQKNLMYALLVGNEYENVILGVDEIENSFSINNAQKMINELQNKIKQTIFSTHSKRIMEAIGNTNTNLIPLYTKENLSLYELLDAIDNTDQKKFIIVEGKYDLPWYKEAISLLGKIDEYIVLPGGGCTDIKVLKTELEKLGKKCICITDGDANSVYKISRECVELYTPLEDLNRILKININKVPESKDEFFKSPIVTNDRNSDTVKSKISAETHIFLKVDNQFVIEISKILKQQ